MSEAAAERAQTEAAAWFARLSQLSVTSDLLREFRDWKQEPGNAEAYARVEAAWAAAAALKNDPELKAATEDALAKRPARPVPKGPRPAGFGPFRSGLAGVALLGVLAAALLARAPPTYRTHVGEQRLVVLADGSRVRLNTDSRIQVRYRAAERDVRLLRGEAFFEVAHDANRPFVVVADGARVRALGTKFDVRQDPAALQVTLLEGRVRVDHGTAAALLSPNQALAVTARGLSAPRPANAAETVGWTAGRLTFRDVALADAVAEVNRYAPRKLILAATPALAQARISGVFETGDTGAFAAAVGRMFDLQVSNTGHGPIRLTPRTPATAA